MIATFLSALLLSTPSPAARYAIIIGHNRSPELKRPTLRYADDDAARFYELVAPTTKMAHLFTSFDADSEEVFPKLVPIARIPTRQRLREAIKEIRGEIQRSAARGAKTELFFFYAGHGELRDGEGAITLADGRFTRSEFRSLLLEEPRADVTHVVVDACKSYFFAAGRGPGGTREPYPKELVSPDVTHNVGYILSTSSDADSHEWSAFAGGVFSHEVRSALIGGADADGDGGVDYDELGAFVAVANESVPFPRFRPAVYVSPPSGGKRAAMFSPKEVPGATSLELAAETSGRVTILDQRGVRYLDLNKAAGAPLKIALLPNVRYEIQWQGKSYSIEPSGASIKLADLTPSAEKLAARGEQHKAYESLFDLPFGPDVVRGFRLNRAVAFAETPPDDQATRWYTSLLLGGGAAMVAGGALFAVLGAQERTDAAAAPQIERPSFDARADRLATAGSIAIGAGVAALAMGLIFYFVEGGAQP